MMPDLFSDLPERHPPGNIYSDRHMLTLCTRCAGTGREECPYPARTYAAEFWDPTCRGYNGSGRKLIYVGSMTDA
mgnify:CR=1 FL=1